MDLHKAAQDLIDAHTQRQLIENRLKSQQDAAIAAEKAFIQAHMDSSMSHEETFLFEEFPGVFWMIEIDPREGVIVRVEKCLQVLRYAG